MEQTNVLIGCPKCGSTQISANKKGFSGSKAIAGAVLTGGIGLLAGTIGSNKIKITCLSCGNQFRPGEGKNIIVRDNGEIVEKKPAPKIANSNFNRLQCADCNTENFISYTYCKNCGKELDEKDGKIHSERNINLFTCPSCKRLAARDGKYCPYCKTPVIQSKKEGCFVATACYGDYDAPEVIALRLYRDRVLEQTYRGRVFIKIYYLVSPSLARIIENSDYFKRIVKVKLLNPLIERNKKIKCLESKT